MYSGTLQLKMLEVVELLAFTFAVYCIQTSSTCRLLRPSGLMVSFFHGESSMDCSKVPAPV